MGELYAYVPKNDANIAALRAVPPRSIQHPDYGFSVGRGAWTFVPGKWTTVAERVKMNTVGQANGTRRLYKRRDAGLDSSCTRPTGEVEVFIDGQSVIKVTGLMLRDTEARTSCAQGLHVETFFGGEGCLA